MSIHLDKTKQGKPSIVLDRYKYRLERILVNGETSWRCLGKDCQASIRTNADHTEVVGRKNQHSGRHPVTMRSLTPDTKTNNKSLPTTPMMSQLLKPSCYEVGCQTEDTVLKSKDELLFRIDTLQKQRDDVIDKVQELTVDRENIINSLTKENDKLKLEIEYLQARIINLETGNITKQEIIASLNDNINSLNIKIENLKENTKTRQNVELDVRNFSIPPPQAPTVPTRNRFLPLSDCDEQTVHSVTHRPSKPIGLRKKKQRRNFNISISLHSDSHGRGMNHLLTKRFNSKNTVVRPSFVKPGAPIEEVVKGIKSQSHHYKNKDYVVCIAGTNNITKANVNTNSILKTYKNMAESSPCTRFLISTVPMRYDLGPYSQENYNIRNLNRRLKTLQQDARNIRLLDLGSKQWHLFRGIHFHQGGKRDIVNDIFHIIEDWSCEKVAPPMYATVDKAAESLPGPSGLQPPADILMVQSLLHFPPLPTSNHGMSTPATPLSRQSLPSTPNESFLSISPTPQKLT